MDSFGEHLRRARENKGISIEEVSRATKISVSVLQALENDQYDVLPPKVYVRGFVRSYCRYVGLDEAELLRTYEQAAAEKRTAASRAREQGTKKGARTRLLLLLVLFAALLALFIHDSSLRQSEEVSPKPQKDVPARKAKVSPAKQTAIPEERWSPPDPIPVRLVIGCVEKTWLEITIDHDQPFEENLLPGDQRCWIGEESIELKIGNGGGVSISVNEIPLKPCGKSQEVVNLLLRGDEVSLNDGEFQELRLWERHDEITTRE